jgi:hypothetical protein
MKSTRKANEKRRKANENDNIPYSSQTIKPVVQHGMHANIPIFAFALDL